MEKKKQELEKQNTQAKKIEEVNGSDQIAPSVDIYERDDALVVLADMPGVERKSIDINVENRVLTIKGTMMPEHHEGYHLSYQEYMPANYRRSFNLTNEVDIATITARYNAGVLEIVLPKAKEAQLKKIEVQTV